MAGRRFPWPLLAAGIAAALALAHSGEIRERAEAALGQGMPKREAELARGFVLGEDDGVDAETVEDFRRSGLAHLLAVSGQNVTLLALLAMPLLAALGLPLRARLYWVLGLIAVYVPLAGSGPTVVRAALMGGLGLLAILAGRRASRLYALLVAGAAMLALDPGVAGDVGWQLSFAAVLGILAMAGPLRRAVLGALGDGGWRRALADGAAATVAATLATAPLIAFHFGAVSTTTLVANLLALPAVAPAMWLGMLAIAAGQVPGFPVGLLNALNAPLLAYVAQVAAWCAGPGWAYPEVRLGPAGLAAAYAALASSCLAVALAARRLRVARAAKAARSARVAKAARSARVAKAARSAARARTARVRRSSRGVGRKTNALRGVAAIAAVGGALWAAWGAVGPLPWLGAPGGTPHGTGVPVGLRVSVLDVGQGDAILLRPPRAPAVLVDTGPPGGDVVDALRDAGAERLAAVVLTHDESDHAGGLGELLAGVPVGRVLRGAPLGRETLAAVRAAAAPVGALARGDALRSGALRLEVLWPPGELLGDPRRAGADPNVLSLVLLARWGRFTMLLTGDAEAESTPLDPGPVDVLKVAHHGSEDGGLADLLERTRPRLAVISVGEGNPFGHPDPSTLAALAAHGVRVLRTDREGDVEIGVARPSLP